MLHDTVLSLQKFIPPPSFLPIIKDSIYSTIWSQHFCQKSNDQINIWAIFSSSADQCKVFYPQTMLCGSCVCLYKVNKLCVFMILIQNHSNASGPNLRPSPAHISHHSLPLFLSLPHNLNSNMFLFLFEIRLHILSGIDQYITCRRQNCSSTDKV